MTIARTSDFVLIKRLATDPAIFPHISDDLSPEPEAWEPMTDSRVCYLVASDEHGVFGFGVFIPVTWVCWRAHFGFLPRAYGQAAAIAFGGMFEWMWANTLARRIVGEICSDNRRAIRFAQRAGAEVYGINRGSLLKDGVLRDQTAFGMSKPL